jgi:pimeloyl-ACP methyl ester carboxylesterase
VRDSQPKFHQATQDPSPFWRLGAVASRCVMETGVKDGKAAYDFADHLSSFSTRVRFIVGGESEVLGTAFQERQRQLYPASDLVTIPGAGHDVAWVLPAPTLAAIHAYLADIGMGTVSR